MTTTANAPRAIRISGLITLGATLFLAGCRTSIGVYETGFEPVYDELSRNVLGSDHSLSQTTEQALASLGVTERYWEDPQAVLAEVESRVVESGSRDALVSVAELHYDLGLRTEDSRHFMDAALYAYFYLFGEFDSRPNPYSSRFRLACDLYNRGLARALLVEGEIDLESRVLHSMSGPVEIEVSRPGFAWGEESFSAFLPADAFEIRGLRNAFA